MQARLDEVAAAAEAAAAGSEGLDAFHLQMEARLAEVSSEAAGRSTALREYVDEQLQTVRSEAATTTAASTSRNSGSEGSEAAVVALGSKVEGQLSALRGQLGDIRLEASEAAEAAGGVQDYVDSALDDMKAWVTDQLATGQTQHAVENGDSAADSEPAAKAGPQLQALVAPLEERLAALQSALDGQKAEAESEAAELRSDIRAASEAATGWRGDFDAVAADVAALREDLSDQVAGLREELLSIAASVAAAKAPEPTTSAGAEAAAAEQAELQGRLEAMQEHLDQLQRSQAALEEARADAASREAEAVPAPSSAASDDQLAALKEELTGYVDAVADSIRAEAADAAAAAEAGDGGEEDSPPAPGLTVATGPSQEPDVRHQARELVKYADSWVAALADALGSFSDEAGPAAAAVSALYGQLDEALLGLAGELAAAQGSPGDDGADQPEVRLFQDHHWELALPALLDKWRY